MNNVANLKNYVLLNHKNPLGYTYNLIACFAALIKREDSEVLIHVYANEEDYDRNHFINGLNYDEKEVIKVEIFKGPQTSDKILDMVKEELYERDIDYEIKDSYLNMFETEGSIGYNHNEQCYYKVDNNIEPEKVGNELGLK